MAEKMGEIMKRVEEENAARDNSYAALNEEEKSELSLFHSLKQDPYYKHHIKHWMRHRADELND